MKFLLLSFLAGLVAALGFEPLGIWVATLVGFAGLLWLVEQAPSLRSALARGWWFGVGHFVLGLNWIATAFTYQSAMPAWLGWVSVGLLSLYLAVYPAMAAGLAWRHGRVHRTAFVLISPPPGSSPNGCARPSSPASPGTRSAVTLIDTAARAGRAVDRHLWRVGPARAAGRRADAGCDAATARAPCRCSPRSSCWRSSRRWFRARTLPGKQPADPRRPAQYRPAGQVEAGLRGAQLRAARAAVGAGGGRAADPAVARGGGDRPAAGRPRQPLRPGRAARVRAKVANLLGPNDLLLTGGVTLRSRDGIDVSSATNSVFAMDPQGRILGRYDKAHLVPYGEYLPMRSMLSTLGLSRLAPGDIDFDSRARARARSTLPGIGKVGFQLCYEIIFSGQVVDRAHRPDFIFNPSNDAWFGALGPAAASRPGADARDRGRAAGAARDADRQFGGDRRRRPRCSHSLPWRTAGAIDARLPAAKPPTLFARTGNVAGVPGRAAADRGSRLQSRAKRARGRI